MAIPALSPNSERDEKCMLYTNLHTERLWLKSVSSEDTAFILNQFSNDCVNRHLFDAEPMKDTSDAEELIRFYMAPEPRGQHRWILIRRQDGVKMGTCVFHCLDLATGRIETGYDLQPNYWGNGYMLEAMQTILSFAKAYLPVKEINACIHTENLPSILLAKKLGFVVTKSELVTLHDVEYPHHQYTLRL